LIQIGQEQQHFTGRPVWIFDLISLSSSQNWKCFRLKL